MQPKALKLNYGGIWFHTKWRSRTEPETKKADHGGSWNETIYNSLLFQPMQSSFRASCFSHKRCKDACSSQKTSEAKVPHGSARGELIPGSPSLVPRWPSWVFSISKSRCQRQQNQTNWLSQDDPRYKNFAAFQRSSASPSTLRVSMSGQLLAVWSQPYLQCDWEFSHRLQEWSSYHWWSVLPHA